ncbi:MAG: lytic transglycosylase domain-containing protein [Psychrilyobacter sp.]|nr:lytic transglycosylase domain-containing protein [Psychrilyobacter sp.]
MMRKVTYLLFFLLFLGFIGIVSIVKYFPLPYYPEIVNISKKYNVEKEVIYSVIKIESDFRQEVVSHKGAVGLMQLIPSTAQWVASINEVEYSKEKLIDPVYNMEIGTMYLSHLLTRYDLDRNKMLIAYNAGPSRLKDGKWKEFKETRNYLIKFKITYFFYKLRIFFK